jgi:DNA polymerase eta
MEKLSNQRAVIHLDLDAFYAQVELVRLGLDPSTPLCVQQWNGILAVNYPAREFGIKRFMSIEECKSKCPQIVFQHVIPVWIP